MHQDGDADVTKSLLFIYNSSPVKHCNFLPIFELLFVQCSICAICTDLSHNTPCSHDVSSFRLFKDDITGLHSGPMGQRSKTTAKAGFSVFIKTTR